MPSGDILSSEEISTMSTHVRLVRFIGPCYVRADDIAIAIHGVFMTKHCFTLEISGRGLVLSRSLVSEDTAVRLT